MNNSNKMKPVFIILILFHDKKTLHSFALKNLQKQTVAHNIITIDNSSGRFSSAAEAYNSVLRELKPHEAEYVIVMHQDIALTSPSWLSEAYAMIQDLPAFGIAGVAGARSGKNRAHLMIVSNLIHGFPPIKDPFHHSLSTCETVQTLDECFIIFPITLLEHFLFDEKVCDHWHLHVVDLCLSLKEANFEVYVLPITLCHASRGMFAKNVKEYILNLGEMPKEYYRILKKIMRKHKIFFPYIYTTCGMWQTRKPLLLQKVTKILKRIVRKINSLVSSKDKEYF